MSTISRFWICWDWEFIIIMTKIFFPGSYRYTNSIELVPRFGLRSSPLPPLILSLFLLPFYFPLSCSGPGHGQGVNLGVSLGVGKFVCSPPLTPLDS